jgi:hypothetical protein
MPFIERQFELSDGAQVVLRFNEPVADQKDFRCDFEIAWRNDIRKSHAFGVDAVQAILMAMQKAHIDLLASSHAKAGELTWLGNRNLGLPLPANIKPGDFA